MIDTQMIKRSADIRTVLSFYGLEPNAKGFIPCFAHREKTASMKVYDNNTVHCFGCHADYDVIGVVQFMEKCNFDEAVKKICAICRLPFDKELSAKEKAEIRRKMEAVQRQKQLEKEEEQRQHSEWCDICDRLHVLEDAYQKTVPPVNTPEFEKFQENLIAVNVGFTLGLLITELNSELDKRREQW